MLVWARRVAELVRECVVEVVLIGFCGFTNFCKFNDKLIFFSMHSWMPIMLGILTSASVLVNCLVRVRVSRGADTGLASFSNASAFCFTVVFWPHGLQTQKIIFFQFFSLICSGFVHQVEALT